MKDENDKRTLELAPSAQLEGAAAVAAAVPAAGRIKGKPKRLPNQSCTTPPPGAKPLDGMPPGFGPSVVPVSSVARDWGVSSRRVRTLLVTGRLSGRQLENGYWEVFYPYRYVFGTRGPALKRQRNQPEKPKKPERMPVW